MSRDIKRDIQPPMFADPVNRMKDAVDRVVSSGGAVSIDSQHPLFESMLQLSQAEYLDFEEGTFSIRPEFEQLLLRLANNDAKYLDSLLRYRELMASLSAPYNTDTSLSVKLSQMASTSERLMFLSNKLDELQTSLDALRERNSELEDLTKEMDRSLAVVESIVFDENPDS